MRGMRKSAGFTLLEVLLATGIMAVGTTSVLVVMATAVGMASQRQVNLRRAQVADEARDHAQTVLDGWNPAASAPAPAPVKGPKTRAAAAPTVTNAPAKVEGKRSARYDGFAYDLAFEPKDKLVPEKGFDVTITVRYGGGDLTHTTTTSMMSTVVRPEEFATSRTWEEERRGLADQQKTNER